MRVEVFADVICPWCGIGHHRLEEARARFDGDVEIVRRSFLLDPFAPIGKVEPVPEMLVKKGYPADRVGAMTERVEEIARSEGIQPYHVRDNRVGSTALAHELAALARSEGKADAAWSALYRAYFGEARSIFDAPSLVRIGEEIGLDAETVRGALDARVYEPEVKRDLLRARELGVRGVPFFVFDERFAVSGAQPVEVLLRAFEHTSRS